MNKHILRFNAGNSSRIHFNAENDGRIHFNAGNGGRIHRKRGTMRIGNALQAEHALKTRRERMESQ